MMASTRIARVVRARRQRFGLRQGDGVGDALVLVGGKAGPGVAAGARPAVDRVVDLAFAARPSEAETANDQERGLANDDS
jgi:hypothetical protein